MNNEPKDPMAQLNDGVASVQRDYDHQHTKILQELAALEAAHTEWISSDDGKKAMMLSVVRNLQSEGENAAVYDETVKLAVKNIIASIDAEADKAMARLKKRFKNTDTGVDIGSPRIGAKPSSDKER
jgi:hypothetical protein